VNDGNLLFTTEEQEAQLINDVCEFVFVVVNPKADSADKTTANTNSNDDIDIKRRDETDIDARMMPLLNAMIEAS